MNIEELLPIEQNEEYQYTPEESLKHNPKYKGLLLVKPISDTVLLLDIDNSTNKHCELLTIFSEKNKFKDRIETTSVSGNKHIYIQLYDPKGYVLRLGLQSMLGV